MVWSYGAYKINGNLFGIETSTNTDGTINSRWVGKKVNFLGDSITQSPTSRVGTVENQLPNVIKSALGLSEARNYGVGGTGMAGGAVGTETQRFIDRYPAMSDDVDLIFVFGGVNDYALDNTHDFGTMNDRTADTFYGAMHVLLDGLITKYPDKTIVFMTPIHKTDDTNPNGNTGKVLDDYAQAEIEVCRYYGIPYIDGFTIGLNPNTAQSETLFHDITHPNGLGSQMLGKAIASRLAAL